MQGHQHAILDLFKFFTGIHWIILRTRKCALHFLKYMGNDNDNSILQYYIVSSDLFSRVYGTQKHRFDIMIRNSLFGYHVHCCEADLLVRIICCPIYFLILLKIAGITALRSTRTDAAKAFCTFTYIHINRLYRWLRNSISDTVNQAKQPQFPLIEKVKLICLEMN